MYKPTASDIAWANNFIRATAQNARWGIPRSGVVFEVDHDKKCLRQVAGPTEYPEIDINRAVFEKVGYSVFGLSKPVVETRLGKPHWGNIRRK